MSRKRKTAEELMKLQAATWEEFLAQAGPDTRQRMRALVAHFVSGIAADAFLLAKRSPVKVTLEICWEGKAVRMTAMSEDDDWPLIEERPYWVVESTGEILEGTPEVIYEENGVLKGVLFGLAVREM